MDKLEFRVVIKFLVLDRLTSVEIYLRSLQKLMGTLLLQFQPLKSGHINLNVVAHCSKMTHVKDGQKLQPHRKLLKRYTIILDDKRVEVCEVAEAVGILEERVQNILCKELGIQKLCTRWVLHLLNADRKQMCKQHLQQCLD